MVEDVAGGNGEGQLVGIAAFGLGLGQRKRAGQAQVHRELCWTVAVVPRDQWLSGLRRQLEDSECRAYQGGASGTGGKCRTVSEERVAIDIAAQDNIEGA